MALSLPIPYRRSQPIKVGCDKNHRYSNHNNNIKCVSLTIKCIDFETIHYVINLDVILSFMIFSDFDSMLLSIYILV